MTFRSKQRPFKTPVLLTCCEAGPYVFFVRLGPVIGPRRTVFYKHPSFGPDLDLIFSFSNHTFEKVLIISA